jgi:hypothetical protein
MGYPARNVLDPTPEEIRAMRVGEGVFSLYLYGLRGGSFSKLSGYLDA